MAFKAHPYYDRSDADDWLSVPAVEELDDTESEPNAALVQVLQIEKQRLCDFALERIRLQAGADYLAERPYPDVNEFLFFPISDHGFQVYVEYVFFQRPHENTPDSDFWWAIINCAYAVGPFPTGRREYYVIGLGWAVA